MGKADPETTRCLHELDGHIRRLGLSIGDHLRPGLADDEMDAITHPLGIDLPPQLRALWAWHDGAGYPNWMITRQMQFPKLEWLVRDVLMTRRINDEGSRRTFERHWFLAFAAMDGGGPAVDCRPGANAAVYGFTHYDEPTSHPQFESFTALLEWWLELFAAGHLYKPDDNRQVAQRDLDLPEERMMLV